MPRQLLPEQKVKYFVRYTHGAGKGKGLFCDLKQLSSGLLFREPETVSSCPGMDVEDRPSDWQGRVIEFIPQEGSMSSCPLACLFLAALCAQQSLTATSVCCGREQADGGCHGREHAEGH